MDTKTETIAVIAVIAVLAIAGVAFMMMSNGGGNDSKTTMSLSANTTEKGGYVDVYLDISGNPGIASYVAYITYDSTKLTYVSTVASPGADYFLQDEAKDGTLSLVSVLSIDKNYTANGHLAKITFRSTDYSGASQNLSLTMKEVTNLTEHVKVYSKGCTITFKN